MSSIKIAVACHKPSELPNNSLYVPVQVGSAIAKKRLEGLAHDDEGENISSKNASYCELTAQYWAWKNLEADYLGLCHYRRYLTFAEGNFELDERNQIQAGFLDEFNKKRFGLEDESRMREIIEQNDCVVGELEDVSGLETPHGKQKTVYLHWAMHDRAFINVKDFDRMIALVDEFYPQYSKELHDYLNGKLYLGYNCFVMKKELFDQLCEFEFDILSRLEQEIDMTHYSQMRTRVFGYMAETLYSVFIYHLENIGYKVKHLPLVYFNATDPIESFDLKPIEGAIPIVINEVERNFSQCIIDVALQSFLSSCSGDTKYDILLVQREMPTYLKQALQTRVASVENVTLRFIDAKMISEGIIDHAGKTEIPSENENVHEYRTVDIMSLLPWILPSYDRILFFDWNTLFNAPVDDLWNTEIPENSVLCASHDLVALARLNEPLDGLYKHARHDVNIAKPYNMFGTSTMLMNLKKMRAGDYQKEIININRESFFMFPPFEVLNKVYEDKVSYLDFEWAYPAVDSTFRTNLLPSAPLEIYKSFQDVDEPRVVYYDPMVCYDPQPLEFSIQFWSFARMSAFYEVILASLTDMRIKNTSEEQGRIRIWLEKHMPAGGDARKAAANMAGSVLSVIYPAGSERRRKIEETWTADDTKARLLKYLK